MHCNGFDGHPLGIVLVSSNSTCKVCGGNLLVRADRPSFMTAYTNRMGTVPVMHFQKYCSDARRGCSFETTLLKDFDAELLIEQVSYYQQCDV